MSSQTKQKTLDLKKVRQIIFDDIDVLLEDLGLEYEQESDNIFMSCPIHEGSDNKHGLSISLSKQAWRCWTRGCHEEFNTDIFGFIRGVLSSQSADMVSFSDVLRYICKIYNVDNAKTKNAKDKKPEVEDPFRDIVRIFQKKKEIAKPPSVSIQVKTLDHSPYFEARGFDRKTLSHFGVKDCSDNLSPMRHRAIIPIYSFNSKIGYIARATKAWLQPKYLFSEGLVKTDHLYNYDNAIEHGQDKSCLFLVEGQGDVWKLYEAGVINAVGLFGKDISKTQATTLKRSGVTTLVVLTDNDQAGRESKIKINRRLGRMFNLKFPHFPSNDLGVMTVDKIKENILLKLEGYF